MLAGMEGKRRYCLEYEEEDRSKWKQEEAIIHSQSFTFGERGGVGTSF